ncbi:hypothetical protein C9374_003914 [Naegleria lovaniensis]|uniref:Uncharacterized protein n=1 Tax=Naegleria lovaniensis TaxID=51637 RepID=A0AA88KYL9_NAELO|nr:uncharacterized protein C9374_003914 [Naegleria lovaniensis]KAG2394150.1 hypothetical protein C9374_003914 [Naegleria lovaniensis]
MDIVFVPFPSQKYGEQEQVHGTPEYFTLNEKESIKQLHYSAWNNSLFIVSHSGIVYLIKTSGSDDPNIPEGISKLHPFDGSTSLRVKEVVSYTEAILFVVKDMITQENYIYGIGSNGYYRMSFSKDESLHWSTPELMFSPKSEVVGANNNDTLEISHCGCCYSFSLCIINDRDVHFTGQNWVRCSDEYLSSNSYHAWKFRVQQFKQRVLKMECGDFHSVVLHDDHTVSVAGSNSSNQLTSYPNETFESNVPFVNIPIHYLCVSNVLSGSNTVLYVSEENEQCKDFYFCGSKKYNFGEYSTPSTSNPMLEHKLVKFNNSSNSGEENNVFDNFSNIFDAQFTRDLFMGRSICNPKLIYLVGNSYYRGVQYNGNFFDISKVVPFDRYSKGMFPRSREADFYRNIVKFALQHSGYVIYFDYSRGLVLLFFEKLLKATNTANINNHRLLDITVVTHH